jgi:hypothetical protein
MANSQQQYESVTHVIITSNTKEILQRRATSDYRVSYAHHVLFGEHGIRDDIAKNSRNGLYYLRNAHPGDTFVYTLIADYNDIKSHIEMNLRNISKLRAQKELSNLRRVWILCYNLPSDKANDTNASPITTIFVDPDASDVNNIIKENTIILGVFIVVEYDSPETLQNPKLGSASAEWVFISPGDPNNITEYNNFLKEKEADSIGKMFYLDFFKKEEIKI